MGALCVELHCCAKTVEQKKAVAKRAFFLPQTKTRKQLWLHHCNKIEQPVRLEYSFRLVHIADDSCVETTNLDLQTNMSLGQLSAFCQRKTQLAAQQERMRRAL